MISIRGAITVNENTGPAILDATERLLVKIIAANKLSRPQIVDIIFSATKDLDAAYPAAAARSIGIVEAGLFCVQEMNVEGSLPMCIRILLHAEANGKNQSDARHIYLDGAVVLRPDLSANTADVSRSGLSANAADVSRSGLSTSATDVSRSDPAPYISIAIDGPSGAGKSTVAREVARASGVVYVDTGAMYRAVALFNIKAGADLKDHNAVEASLNDIFMDIRYDHEKGQRLILNDEDVTEALRTQQVADGSSVVAAYPNVRLKLVAFQRDLAKKQSVVMDGRDIGTHVLPHAQIKIYLDAGIEERVSRRMYELSQRGLNCGYDEVKREIEVRDYRDMNRSISPLVRAADAVYIKSDGMTVREITEMVLKEIAKVR